MARPFDLIGKVFRRFRADRDGALLVDPRPAALLDGRLFRTFYDFSLADGASDVIEFVSPVDFVLHSQTLTVDEGSCTYEVFVNATPSGTFDTDVPIFGMNRTDYRKDTTYEHQVTMKTGGTVSGGVLAEVVRLKTVGTSNRSSTIGGGITDSRFLPAGTYHLKLTADGATTGIHCLIFEEVL